MLYPQQSVLLPNRISVYQHKEDASLHYVVADGSSRFGKLLNDSPRNHL